MKPIDEMSNANADKAGVERFTKAMHSKMRAKRAEGRGGWHRERHVYASAVWPETHGTTQRGLQRQLRHHLRKGLSGSNLVDIGNFCMMLWNRENPNG